MHLFLHYELMNYELKQTTKPKVFILMHIRQFPCFLLCFLLPLNSVHQVVGLRIWAFVNSTSSIHSIHNENHPYHQNRKLTTLSIQTFIAASTIWILQVPFNDSLCISFDKHMLVLNWGKLKFWPHLSLSQYQSQYSTCCATLQS